MGGVLETAILGVRWWGGEGRFRSQGVRGVSRREIYCQDIVPRQGGSGARLLDSKTWESNFNVVLLATARRLSLNYNYCLIISDLLHNLTTSRVV